jgi:hypothetical protein
MIRTLFVCLLLLCTSRATFAQPIGTFRWQMQPYCNVVALNVTQIGGVYTLDGFDDQCGGPQYRDVAWRRAAARGGAAERRHARRHLA